nr:hypothetical protein [Tanacetum cinerariifolium]
MWKPIFEVAGEEQVQVSCGQQVQVSCEEQVKVDVEEQNENKIGEQVEYEYEDEAIISGYDSQYNGDSSENVSATLTSSQKIMTLSLGYFDGVIGNPDAVSMNYMPMLDQNRSVNPNTTAKIEVKRNTDLSLPIMALKRIYVCFGSLKRLRTCRRELLGLDSEFLKGSFPGQVLVVVVLDANNEIYILAYALAEAENKN